MELFIKFPDMSDSKSYLGMRFFICSKPVLSFLIGARLLIFKLS